jgi:poly-gamma-glutamate synthesis protein (capsule biosynthesis protein)
LFSAGFPLVAESFPILIPARGVILYDTGDFVDDYAIDPALRNDLSALFLVRLPTTAGVG